MNLELIDTDALINELMSRFDAAVFAGVKIRREAPQTAHYAEAIRGKGDQYHRLGLASRITDVINAEIAHVYKPIEGDDPYG